jgi:hypothetical protein
MRRERGVVIFIEEECRILGSNQDELGLNPTDVY